MVKTLVALVGQALRSAWILELVGAVLVTVGLYLVWGTGAAAIGGGVAVLAKSAERDLRSGQ